MEQDKQKRIEEVSSVGAVRSSVTQYVPDHIGIHVLYAPDEVADFLSAIQMREMTEASVNKIIGLFRRIQTPVTVVCEDGYVDKAYRDTYYTYFASKFTQFGRDCKRLAFFQGELNPALFHQYDDGTEALLQEHFVGICVLKPIRYGEVGRTILAPAKLQLPGCYVKTAAFRFHILGHALTVEGYPYSSQDMETMTCAEVSVWSILEYYGTRYPEYRTVLPSEILRELEKLSAERVLPSRGSEFGWMSALFKTFGFTPRLYDRRAFGNDAEQRREFKKLFHYYVESGIPLAVGISGRKREEEVRHSVVCVGHGRKRRAVKAAEIRYMGEEQVYPYVDSAFLYEDYVMMDDNRIPYQVEPFGKLSGWSESEVRTFAVPLHRYVFLEAGDVSVLVNTIFTDVSLGITGLIPAMGEQVDQNNPLILRVFLTPSGTYRNFRAGHAKDASASTFYGSVRLPEYIWVAEISTYAAYLERRVYGEIIIDATSGRGSHLESLILIRYLDHLGVRAPEEKSIYAIDEGLRRRVRGLSFPYEMFSGNLTECGSDEL